jgi:hypothetical protein
MAKFPNITPANDNWSISHSWTQPYLPTNFNPFYQPSPEHVVTVELIKLNEIDKQVQNMLTYPDAERIINSIVKQRGESND